MGHVRTTKGKPMGNLKSSPMGHVRTAKGKPVGHIKTTRASQQVTYLQKLIQDDSQAPDVNSRAAVLLALDNLRSRELRSSTQLPQVARERRRDACQPKISNLDI